MKKSPFLNRKLDNNNIEKKAWLKLPLIERLEQALSWGTEIEFIQHQIFGNKIKSQKIKQDLEMAK